MTLNTFASGVNTSFSTELNENFKVRSILAIDTSTTLNFSRTTTGTDTTSTTLSLSSSLISDVTEYIEVKLNGTFRCFGRGSGSGSGQGQIYIDVYDTVSSTQLLSSTLVAQASGIDSNDNNNTYFHEFSFWHPVTAGNRTNGMGLQITMQGVVSEATSAIGIAEYTNRAVMAIGHSL